jgi:hypothetical protein
MSEHFNGKSLISRRRASSLRIPADPARSHEFVRSHFARTRTGSATLRAGTKNARWENFDKTAPRRGLAQRSRQDGNGTLNEYSAPQQRTVLARHRLDPAQQCANTTTRGERHKRASTSSRKRLSLLFSGSRFSIARNADRRRQSIRPKIHSPRDDQLPLALPPSRGDRSSLRVRNSQTAHLHLSRRGEERDGGLLLRALAGLNPRDSGARLTGDY